MAIDTAAKRKSCLGIALHWLRPGIVPDGSDLSASQRLNTQALYSGIDAAAAAASQALEFFIVSAQDRWFVVGAADRWFTVPASNRFVSVEIP
jgi:hypothetical protein